MMWNFYSNPMEFRALRSRESKDGKPFYILVVEDEQGYQNEISCTNERRFAELGRLLKGEWYSFPCVVISTQKYTFTKLGNDPILGVKFDTGETTEV